MAPLPTRPVVIIDEDEIIMIDNESEDEIEILEHGEFQVFHAPPSSSDSFAATERSISYLLQKLE